MSDETTSRATSVSELAAELRALRLRAESPTLSKLQHDTGVSRSVLSSAFSGHQLPSARTIDRTVRALGADPAPWIAQRDAIARGIETSIETSKEESNGSVASEAVATRPDPRMSRRRAVLLAGVAFAAGFAVAVGGSWLVGRSILQEVRAAALDAATSLIEASNSHAHGIVHSGVDPTLSPCINDAKVVTSQIRDSNTKLEIIWSAQCDAGWARITRYDANVSNSSMTVSIYPETAEQGPDRQTTTEPNAQIAYTTLIVRPNPETRLCAVGAVTLDGVRTDLGEPLCT
jgi:transcriptional regulator with XRE-family HTH domain